MTPEEKQKTKEAIEFLASMLKKFHSDKVGWAELCLLDDCSGCIEDDTDMGNLITKEFDTSDEAVEAFEKLLGN